jgi:GNAT superfamily N-acetyltransferase
VTNLTEIAVAFREAGAADMPGISRVRASVGENLLTSEQLEQRGITNASVAASFLTDAKGWVAAHQDEIVAFSIANKKEESIFALFVLPAYEGHGIGSRLLDLALQWLWDSGAERAWLTTAPGSRAARFYERQGWRQIGADPSGDVRFERERPIRTA